MTHASRKNRSKLLGILLAVGLLHSQANDANAEIAPEMYVQLKREAPEILQLRIDRVSPSQGRDGVWDLQCEASIAKVERSKTGLLAGDTVQFGSHCVPPSLVRQGFVGPKSPPWIRAGWTGRVYLSPSEFEEGNPLRIAAFGQSFEAFRVGPIPEPPERNVTIPIEGTTFVSVGNVVRPVKEYSEKTESSLRRADELLGQKQSDTSAFRTQMCAAAGEMAEIQLVDDGNQAQWVSLPLRTHRSGIDGFCFTSPLDEPADLVWSFVVSYPWKGYWYILPKSGTMTGFRSFHSFRDVQVRTPRFPKENFFVMQTLGGGQIQPGKEYVLWFSDSSESDGPLPMHMMLQLVPGGSAKHLDTPSEIARQLGITVSYPLP